MPSAILSEIGEEVMSVVRDAPALIMSGIFSLDIELIYYSASRLRCIHSSKHHRVAGVDVVFNPTEKRCSYIYFKNMEFNISSDERLKARK